MRKNFRAVHVIGAAVLAGLSFGFAAKAAVIPVVDGTFDPVTDLNGGTNTDASAGEAAGAVGWTNYGSSDPVYTQSDLPNQLNNPGVSNPQVAPVAQSGTQVIKAVAVYNSNPALLQQVVPGVIAGTTITFSAAAENSTLDKLGGAAEGVLQMQFENAAGTAVGALVDGGANPTGGGVILSTAPTNVYQNLFLTAAVPAGATQVQLTLLAGPYSAVTGTTSGSVYFDSVSLATATTPEPTSLALLGLSGVAMVARRRRQV